MDFLVHKHLLGRCPLVHDVDFGDNSDGALSGLVPLSGKFESVRNGEILISGDDAEDDGLGVLAVAE